MAKVPTIGPDRDLGARFAWVRANLRSGFISQIRAAKIVGCSPSLIGHIENGTLGCSEDFARKFCGRLGVNYNWLVTGEGKDGEEWASEAPPAVPLDDEPAEESVAEMPIVHGRNEVCRSLVEAAVKETLASSSDKETMRLVAELARKMQREQADVLALLVWDKVKDTPRSG